MRGFNLTKLMRRMVEIDYRHKHRHLPGSLSALPIVVEIYSKMDLENDVFILSKGHSCSALYAVLEELGMKPNVSLVHPERDPANGVTMTSGSLGHGYPTAVGIAWAKKHQGKPGIVHVLLGDGECQEGSNYEAAQLAEMLQLHDRLKVHVDFNGFQGSEALVAKPILPLGNIFPMELHFGHKGYGIRRFQGDPAKSVHLVTEQDFNEIMEELK